MKIEEFLGEYYNEYGDIYPIIRLILYRIDIRGKEGLFTYDEILGSKPGKRQIMLAPLRFLGYGFLKITNSSGYGRKQRNVFVSDTFLKINRYEPLFEELNNSCKLVSALSVGGIGLKHFFRNFYKNRLRIMDFGLSVSGSKLKKAVDNIFDYFMELLKENKTCSQDQKVRLLLEELRVEAVERIDYLAGKFIRSGIDLFLTINQFNLRDVITIMACRKAGIWTKELCHYSNLAEFIADPAAIWNGIRDLGSDSKENYYFPNSNETFMFVHETCQWSSNDAEFFRKYRGIKNIFGENLKITGIGCPEITLKTVKEKKWRNKENVLTIFVPVAVLFLGEKIKNNFSKKDIEGVKEWSKKLYDDIKIVADRAQLEVWVRFHPSDPACFIESDKETIEKNGFKILTLERKGFDEAVELSKYIITSCSSAMTIANIFGCKCYCINYFGEEYDFCGMDIIEVKEKDISKLELVEKESDYNIKENLCMDVARLVDLSL